jgi:hypothetical protein
MPSRQFIMCSWKRECKDNLGGSLQSYEGHFGMEKIVFILKKHFYWPKLRRDINKYIRSFTACAIAKPSIKKKGLYTDLPTLERPEESISMDYMDGLLSTKKGNDCVFVVVAQFLKMVILIAYNKRLTTEATTNIFFKRV